MKAMAEALFVLVWGYATYIASVIVVINFVVSKLF